MPESTLIAAIMWAAVMLVLVNWWVSKHPKASGVSLLICGVLGFAPCLFLAYCIPLHLQAVALVLALPLAYHPRHGRVAYHVGSTILTLAIWLYAVVNLAQKWQQYDEWQQSVPFESMEGRVPVPLYGGSLDGPLWSEVNSETLSRSYGRAWSLRLVHFDRVSLFHGTLGFGRARMLRANPSPEHFEPDLTPPVPQPERYNPNGVSLGEDVPSELRKPFGELHVNSLLDFSYPDGFGYAKNRNEVAGFRPHRFSKVPDPVEKWEVRRVELVGLLLHPSPAVYVSENLPRMQEVKKLPTREPDSFEAEGVKAIRTGEDLYTRGDDRDARMVGAIRSVGQCVECHGGQRGDLLGAFSYRLRRNEK